LPLGAYQVSGEYAMIKFAAMAGAIDAETVVLESLGPIKRAGAVILLRIPLIMTILIIHIPVYRLNWYRCWG
ncbi:porphobilinogen synthase, partial [Salmonella enterica subsp. enterica serovar Kentucky]|nr:porphobilinogen synthase [Salmonella enterica subsp. enterica serovar Kentucky]